MRQDLDELRQIIGTTVVSLGYELVGVQYHQQGAVLRIYIDQAAGISLTDCERVSHQISGVLDVEDPIPGRYTLEVSSPGLDRPLFTAEHYDRFAGHKVRIQLSMPVNGKRKLTGRILGRKDNNIVLDCDGEQLGVQLEQIEKARLIPEF